MKKVHGALIGLVIVTLFFSCWSPLISNQELLQVQDKQSPQLTINYPLDQSIFYDSIIIEGFVQDEAGPGEKGRILRINIEVTGSDLRTTAFPDAQGAFHAELDGSRLDGSITLVITAIDWNNNQTRKKVVLTKSGFTSFILEPENRAIRVFWQGDRQITQVDLYYSIGGATPDYDSDLKLIDIPSIDDLNRNIGENRNLITGLENGQVYGIQLAAHTTSGLVFSEVVKTVPLSPFTLIPQVEAGKGEVRLFWRHFEGIEKYRVLRFTETPGDYGYNDPANYTPIPEVVLKNSYTDDDVKPGQGYYYRIQPVIETVVSGDWAYGVPSGWAYGKVSSIPKLGEILGQAGFNRGVFALAISGNYAYVAARALGFYIVDIRDVDSLHLIGDANKVPGDVWKLVVRGSFLAVCSLSGGTHLFDIQQPANPVYLKTFTVPQGQEAYNAAILGNSIAIAEKSRLVIYDLLGSDDPVSQWPLNSEQIADLMWDESGLYVSTEAGELLLFDLVSNLLNPSRVYSDLGIIQKMIKDDTYLYTIQNGNGVAVYDTSDPENIQLVTSYNKNTSKKLLDLKVDGRFLYLVYEDEGVAILHFDVEKSLLKDYGAIEDLASGVMLEIQGDRGYSITNDFKISVFSILNPAIYRRVNTLDHLQVSDLEIRGNSMFLACGDRGIYKYDICQPEFPLEQSYNNEENFDIKNLECYSNWAVLWNSQGAKIFSTAFYNDTSKDGPGSIKFFSNLELYGARPVEAAFFSDYLYLSFYNYPEDRGIYIYDISDIFESSHLAPKYTINTAFQTRNLVIAEDRLLVSGDAGSVKIGRLTDAINPELVPGPQCIEPRSMSVYQNKLFLSDTDSGIKLFDLKNSSFPLLNTKTQDYYSRTVAQGEFFYSYSQNGLVIYSFDRLNQFSLFMNRDDSVQALAAEDRMMGLVSADSKLSIFLMSRE